jgi:hypothetical protein
MRAELERVATGGASARGEAFEADGEVDDEEAAGSG